MLLLDAGNTNIGCGESEAGVLGRIRDLPPRNRERSLGAMIRRQKDRRVLFASVVPEAGRMIRRLCSECGCLPLECGREVRIPVVNRYRRPCEVGQDRLLNVYAVNRLYPESDIRLVVDLGTALTFDFITRRGAYNGGLIFPGMKTALDALLVRCALLPKNLKLAPTRTLYAKSTREGIVNGIDYGYTFLVAGLIAHLRRKDPGLKVLVTGGGAGLLVKSLCRFDHYDEHLSLRGLNELAREVAAGTIIPEGGTR